MKKIIRLSVAVGIMLGMAGVAAEIKGGGTDELARAFQSPPREAQAWCYWWWLNGNASKEGITRDFEEMKGKGISGALLFDAGEGGPEVPRGPAFMSPGWRELFKHAVREADRCGIVLGVNLCSGWNCGGPWVTPEHAAKKLVSVQTVIKGPRRVNVPLPAPPARKGFYRDIALLAMPVEEDGILTTNQLAGPRPVPCRIWNSSQSVDLTRFMNQTGQLEWDAPAGNWNLLRVGYTLDGHQINVVGSGPGGPEIDPMSAEAMEAHFAETGAKLIADAGPLAGKSLQYFHIDSWEIGQPTWTPTMRAEFRQRRGYDLLRWLPALAGCIVDNPAETSRFMRDYGRTAADLVAANYYGRMRELTVKGGLCGIHPESGGPPGPKWMDALQCLGINDIPMGEFWKRNSEPGGSIINGKHSPTVKQAACAAHIYGKPVCQAEAFTSAADDFIDDPWSMKDIGDCAFCDGLTRNVLCFWVHQPRLDAKPGIQWAHVGTHFDSNLTWWPMAQAWLTYLARCQHMLRQGLFIADFVFLQSETFPMNVKPACPAGFDYDAINPEVLLTRTTARNGRLTLPDGMSYRYLVLPYQTNAHISSAALKKVQELAEAGVTVIGPKTFSASVPGLRDGSLAKVSGADGLPPDIEFRDLSRNAHFDWIHRRAGDAEIYFVSNQTTNEVCANIAFRVMDKQPELWDAVTGEICELPEYREENSRTVVPLQFAPRQSWFVVFGRSSQKSEDRSQNGRKNFPELKQVQEISGSWDVEFDPQWFYSGETADGRQQTADGRKIVFEKLQDWTTRSEDAVKYYSGIATYRKVFDFAEDVRGQKSEVRSQTSDLAPHLFLSLGSVRNVARVRLNGRELGVVWTAPWRVEIPAGLLKEKGNELAIEVANLWPNRLIGDGKLPKDKRRTVTNIPTYEPVLPPGQGFLFCDWAMGTCRSCTDRRKNGKPAQLLPSGLLGPVRVVEEK